MIEDSVALVLDQRDFRRLRRPFNVLNECFEQLPESLRPKERQHRVPHPDDE